MRDRLIKLLKLNPHFDVLWDGGWEEIADYLLANGVIVLPCKVGDVVYILEDWVYRIFLEEKEVGTISIQGTNDFSKELWEDCRGGLIGAFADFGKTLFLTREEAEQALKGGEG